MQKMIYFDVTGENTKEYNLNWLQFPNHPKRTSTTGRS